MERRNIEHIHAANPSRATRVAQRKFLHAKKQSQSIPSAPPISSASRLRPVDSFRAFSPSPAHGNPCEKNEERRRQRPTKRDQAINAEFRASGLSQES